jgi:mannosyltransferase OCH1-like enzyme
MAEDFGGKPFSLVHYLAVKSALEINRPQAILFHYYFEPQGAWWIKAKRLLTLNKVPPPDSFLGRPLHHVAHKSDVVRLQVLKEFGGVYLDLDTICVKPLHALYHHQVVVGEEKNLPYIPRNWREQIKVNYWKIITKKGESFDRQKKKICNAVILSEPNSKFIELWLESYKTFRSRGKDKYWNEHSCILPMKLLKKNGYLATLLTPKAFHYPLYNKEGLKDLFERTIHFPEAYVHHLWNSFSYTDYLNKLTVHDILNKDTTYNLLARKYL